jgi:NAD(P)H-flavin reductase
LADDTLPPAADELIEGEPAMPPEANRTRETCVIEEFWQEGARYFGLRCAVGDDYRARYESPGQYVTLNPETIDPRFLVIANPPRPSSEQGWEFLVDSETELGKSLAPMTSGSTLAISPPEGSGYPVDDVQDRPVICFATGSGVASIRPALQYWGDHADLAPSRVTLYYGESSPADFAYTDETGECNRLGVRTFHCDGSLEDDSAEGFRYVQHAFEADAPNLQDAVVFLAGAPVMKRAVVESLYDRGFPLDRVYTNI